MVIVISLPVNVKLPQNGLRGASEVIASDGGGGGGGGGMGTELGSWLPGISHGAT